MTTIKMIKPVPKLISQGIYNFPKKPLGFHLIPYDQQYETRDRNYIKDFNPYLKSNVSDNLAHSLKDFYMKRYSQR